MTRLCWILDIDWALRHTTVHYFWIADRCYETKPNSSRGPASPCLGLFCNNDRHYPLVSISCHLTNTFFYMSNSSSPLTELQAPFKKRRSKYAVVPVPMEHLPRPLSPITPPLPGDPLHPLLGLPCASLLLLPNGLGYSPMPSLPTSLGYSPMPSLPTSRCNTPLHFEVVLSVLTSTVYRTHFIFKPIW